MLGRALPLSNLSLTYISYLPEGREKAVLKIKGMFLIKTASQGKCITAFIDKVCETNHRQGYTKIAKKEIWNNLNGVCIVI